MLKLFRSKKILCLSLTSLALACSFSSVGAHASAYLNLAQGEPGMVSGTSSGSSLAFNSSRDKKLNHRLISFKSLGLFGALQNPAPGSNRELAHLDLKLPTTRLSARVAAPAFELSLTSIIKSGGVIIHF